MLCAAIEIKYLLFLSLTGERISLVKLLDFTFHLVYELDGMLHSSLQSQKLQFICNRVSKTTPRCDRFKLQGYNGWMQ